MAQYLVMAVNVLKGLDIIKKWSFPDKRQDEIHRYCQQLNSVIEQVRDDKNDLEKMIKWETTGLQYGDVVRRIALGMEYCSKIVMATGEEERIRYQDRLKEVCANQNCTIALNALLDGMTGKGLFRKSILDEFYNKTKGDRPKITALAIPLQQLVWGGMVVIANYETVMRGKEGAEEHTRFFYRRSNEASDEVKSVLDRCVENFEENMLNDLNEFLDTGKPNSDLLDEIRDFMSKKYDWLENFCLVYNDLQGFDKHCFNGDRVESLHRNGKCGIVFYRTKGELPKFSNRYDEAFKINNDVGCANAQQGYKNIVAKLDQKGIGWIGCAVIRRGPDLWYGGTFSSRNATIVGKNATAIILLK